MCLVRGSVDLFWRTVRALGLVSRDSLAAWFLFRIFGVGAHFWDVVFRAVKLSLAVCVLDVGGAVFVLVSSCCFSPSGCFVFVFVAVCSLFCSSFTLSRHLVSGFSCLSFVSRGLHFILFSLEFLGLESLFRTLPRVE
jgi:hypothetical protein